VNNEDDPAVKILDAVTGNGARKRLTTGAR